MINYSHKIKLILLLTCVLAHSCKSSGKAELELISTATPDTTKPYSLRMGETVLKLYPELWNMESATKPRWSYTYGLMALSMLDLWKYTGEEKYYNCAKTYTDIFVQKDGRISDYKINDYNIDHINPGKVLFTFYRETGEQRFKNALDTLRKQLETQPQTKIGGFWHKKRYPHQMWLDGLYMGGPFYAQYAKEFNQPECFNEITRWYINMEKVARDSKTGLLYHAWDESKQQQWADKTTGCSPNFWGRAMGWYGMALVDLLDFLPENHSAHDSILGIINRMADAIIKVQDTKTGVWYQVLDQGNREGNYLEGSVSSMFSYFLLKAVNNSYVDRQKYTPLAIKAFEGTVKYLTKTNADGTLVISPVCAVAGLGGNPYRDGSYEYYINEQLRDNDPKAVGPFIMAAIQYEKLLKAESVAK